MLVLICSMLVCRLVCTVAYYPERHRLLQGDHGAQQVCTDSIHTSVSATENRTTSVPVYKRHTAAGLHDMAAGSCNTRSNQSTCAV
jgi:hypothetical protein